MVVPPGDPRQLVYYWLQQRGRVLTNEYLVKWFLFRDALTRNRSDGSLVRVVVGGQIKNLSPFRGRGRSYACHASAQTSN